jgi:lipoyl-dependent peroxiredoxin
MATSRANARWEGTVKAGKGVMRPGHAGEVAFTAPTRFEGQEGSNPEEMIGAALAGCYSMALSGALERAGATPGSIETSAEVTLQKLESGFTITAIKLKSDVVASGIEPGKFLEVAEATKKGCPVSKALAAVESVTLEATLKSG